MLLGLNCCRYITAGSDSPQLVEEESASGFKVPAAAAQGLPGCEQHRKAQVIQFCTRLQLNCHPVVRDWDVHAAANDTESSFVEIKYTSGLPTIQSWLSQNEIYFKRYLFKRCRSKEEECVTH